MRLLLDTHTLIWWIAATDRLGETVDRLLQDPDNDVQVSVVSAWEIAVKVQRGKLQFDGAFLDAFDARVAQLGWRTLPILTAHAIAAARLPGSHKDPFDRLIAAQARLEGLTVATVDRDIAALGATVIW